MHTPEFYEKADICEHLDAAGAVIWYFKPTTHGFGPSGTPDIVGVHRYRGFFSVEVKRLAKLPTPIQNKRMAMIDAAGGKTFWGTAEKVIREFEAWVA